MRVNGAPARALENELAALAQIDRGALVTAVAFEWATAESIREIGIRPLIQALVNRRDLGALRALVDAAAAESPPDGDEIGEGPDAANELATLARRVRDHLRGIEHWTAAIVWRESWS